MEKGLVYVFTGDGKGKTSAALGIMMRALMNKMKVGWVSWYKEESWPISERGVRGYFKDLEMYFMGEGFYKLPTDKVTEAEHKKAAAEALKQAEKLINRVEVLVLDEVNNAVKDDLLKVEQVLKLLKNRKGTHMVLTGRGADKKIMGLADLVTECKKIKHPFDKGVKALKGLDF